MLYGTESLTSSSSMESFCCFFLRANSASFAKASSFLSSTSTCSWASCVVNTCSRRCCNRQFKENCLRYISLATCLILFRIILVWFSFLYLSTLALVSSTLVPELKLKTVCRLCGHDVRGLTHTVLDKNTTNTHVMR